MTDYVFPGCPAQGPSRAPLPAPRGSAPGSPAIAGAGSAPSALAPVASAQPSFQSPAAGVAVRMYRQGLGDCFLLAFPTADANQSYYVLIDCGVIQGAPNGATNLNAVAQDINLATGGQIDLLVITHRHADHMSGFQYANSVFANVRIENLWLSWLENPQDAYAQGFWKSSGQAAQALANALRAQPAAMAQTASVLDFIGDLGAIAQGGDPLGFVRGVYKKQAGTINYCRPGDGPLWLPASDGRAAATGARLFVLGPPSDPKALAQMDPTGNANEIYLARGGGPNAVTAFMMAMLDEDTLDGDDCLVHEESYPFGRYLRVSRDEAMHWNKDFFRTYYGFDASDQAPIAADVSAAIAADTSAPPGDAEAGAPASEVVAGMPAARGPLPRPKPLQDNPAWRRIDDIWLSSGEELALQLDSCINNTSLVLAIELVRSKKVLLFAADAQVGNWLSWARLPDWSIPAENRTVGVKDLLERTVLYKVGHHGSHNATAAELPDAGPWGLALMSSPDLVAMLPVDEEAANCIKHWQMPWPDLMNHLNAKTGERIMRLDQGIPASNPGPLSQGAWDAFAQQVQVTDLYIQYTLVE
jgi:hypothetical protein